MSGSDVGRLKHWFLGGLMTCAALLALRASAADIPNQAPPADGVLVAFRTDVAVTHRVQAVQRFGLQNDPKFSSRHVARLQLTPEAREAGANLKSIVAALRRDPTVRVAEPDYLVHATGIPNDPRFHELWGLNNTGQTGGTPGADIDAPEAWDQTTGSDRVIVAVIDTGVDYNHPDLAANILRTSTGAVVGYDYASNDADPMDDNGHGTHCAGTIGARGNDGVGLTGVCQNVKIMPLKFLDRRGDGRNSDAIKCIDYAIANGAHVLSNSWGGGGFSQLMLEAVQRARSAGILFVTAAGNDGENNDDVDSYPGDYNALSDNIISVAATDHRDTLANFSNYGVGSVDIAAPGVAIRSTTPRNTYSIYSGTSMATPHVAGAAALVLARYPGLSMARLKARLLYTTDRPAALEGRVAEGRLNVNRALVDDTIPPGAPSSLAPTHRASDALLFTWTAAGDDGRAGAARQYEIRYSQQPISENNFARSLPVANAPRPGVSGSAQQVLIGGLEPNREYYVAIRATDKVGNGSALAMAGPVRTAATSELMCPLEDTGEGTRQFLGTSPWTLHTERSASPTRAYSDSPGLSYRANVDTSLAQNASVALTGFAPELRFSAWTDLEQDYDFVHIEVTTDDGATWRRQGQPLNGNSGAWRSYRVPLADYYGQNVRVRFRLITDELTQLDGIWIDDIRICGGRLTPVEAENPVGPRAPSDLTATALSQGVIQLAWADNSSNETRFRIERQTGAGSFAPIGEVAANTTRIDDDGLEADTTYTYRVMAFNAEGSSRFSNEATRTTLPHPPATPTGVRAEGGNGQVALVWNGSVRAATYTVRRATTSGGPYTPVQANVTGTAYTDSGRTNGVTYYYTVSAANTGGESAPSAEAVGTPQAPARPEAPRSLTARRVLRRANLLWIQSTSAGVTQNRIYRSTTQRGPYSLIATVPATTAHVDRGLQVQRPYFYVVTAVDGQGRESERSNEVTLATRGRTR